MRFIEDSCKRCKANYKEPSQPLCQNYGFGKLKGFGNVSVEYRHRMEVCEVPDLLQVHRGRGVRPSPVQYHPHRAQGD